jgi:hypothetical protein
MAMVAVSYKYMFKQQVVVLVILHQKYMYHNLVVEYGVLTLMMVKLRYVCIDVLSCMQLYCA